MAAFKQGDVVVYRVGTGSGQLTSASTAVFLDEYGPTGALVQSIALPTANPTTAAAGVNQDLTASGSAGSEGLLSLSADGRYLFLTGYDTAPGTASVAGSATAAIVRTIGRVDAAGAIDTTTTTTSYSGNNIRGAASADGSSVYVDGAATGIVLQPLGGSGAGTVVSSTVTNDRAIAEFGGNLYVSTGSGSARGIYEVGSGQPTASGTVSTIVVNTGASSSPYQFFFTHLSTQGQGYDTLYVADSTAGVQKYTLTGSTWALTNSVALTNATGLTGSVDGQGVHLFVTTPTALYALTDTAGYGASDNGTATSIATAATNEAFRGVAFAPAAASAPAPAPTIYVSSGAVSQNEGNGGTTAYSFTLTRSSGTSDATVHYAVAGSGANPADANDFGGTLPSGTATFSGTGLTTTVTVLVTGDTTVEPDEQFTVTLSAPSSGYALGTPVSQTGTIVNDDSADTTPPTLASAVPANAATGVAAGANVVLTFSEAVKAGSGSIVLHPEDGSGDVTIAVGDTSQVSVSGSQVTVNPAADLKANVTYDVVVAAGAVTDIAGNAFAGVAQGALDFTVANGIPSGNQAAAFTIAAPGTYTLAPGETRTETAGGAVAVTATGGAANVDIEGALVDNATAQRAINYAGMTAGTITVGAAGSVQSRNADAIRDQSANGTVDLNNQGQIVATSSVGTPAVGGSNPGTGYAVNYGAVLGASGAGAGDYTSGGTITNGSATNAAALIRADNGDAVRLGSHETLVNYGTINGNGPVNDASTNNSFATNGNTSTATTYDISRGVRINQAGATAVDIENYGTINGAQHGVDTGVADATNIVITNHAGAAIIGGNGSGIGADTTGAASNTVTVNNYGTIGGELHPQYDRAGYATNDGDGDGVDIDGGATVNNYAGGRIIATGASGYDSNGRANQSEGISIGGGIVVNAGTIQGAGAGIVVNNDGNTDGSRSGVAATTITNDATGTITGQATYAIRLENKTGTAADNDTIVNYGAITGNGAVPTAIVNREDGNPDPGTVGTLDGTTYTAGANAGSARFIAGDGAAIQMGEGDDTLSNYGTITGTAGNGKSGLAISLEGGNDTLTLHTGGTVSGGIDGGVGSDTLILALDDRATSGADATTGNNSGVTTGTLAAVTNFETLDVRGGTWTIADAQGYATGVTIENGATLVLGTGASLAGAITDAGHLTAASSGALTLADAITGAGVVEQAGSGTLTLANAASSYGGGTLLTAGTLDVATAGAAGTGAISFVSGAAQVLHVEAAAVVNGSFANALANFGTDGDVLDVAGIGAATASYDAASGVLTLTGTSTERFTIGTGYGNDVFTTVADGASGAEAGTRVTVASTTPASLSIANASVAEGNSGTTNLVFTVTASQAAPAAGIGFHVNTADGTATVADNDYVGLNDYVGTIAAGQTSATFAVTVNGDTRYEADETFTATISQPSGLATIGTAQATGTIVNDDAAPRLTIGNPSVSEGNGGTTLLTYTVHADAPAPAGGISFDIATADGTATLADNDYVAKSVTGATIAAGATDYSFQVTVNGDTKVEGDETVLVNLSNPHNATIATAQATGTIVNDDYPTSATLLQTDFGEFTAAGFAPGGVAGGLDSNVWRVVGLSDNANPAFGFTGPSGGDFGRGVINGTADPVAAGVYSPSANAALVVQPTGAELDVAGAIDARLANTTGQTITSLDVAFDWAYRNNATRADNLQLFYSTDGTNFTAVPATAFSTPGAATAGATFTAQHESVHIDGVTVANGGNVYLRWEHVNSSGSGSRDEVGIDNVNVVANLSSAPVVTVADIARAEGNAGTTDFTFTLTRSNPNGAASVDYATADGTARAGSDYQAASGTATFADGQRTATVTVHVNGDTAHEADETFFLNLSNPSAGLGLPSTRATATIQNDDSGPVAIYDIQGAAHTSPFNGQSVTTTGVVTQVVAHGFYMQDPNGDGDAATSDGIYVFLGASATPNVAVGNAVSVAGVVSEYAGGTNNLSVTEITSPTVTVTAQAGPTIAPVLISTDGDGRAPSTQYIDNNHFTSFDPGTNGADFYESLEGMLVTVKNPLVVSNTYQGATFVVASNGNGATGLNSRDGLTLEPNDQQPEKIKIYDTSQNHAQGEQLNSVTGILTYFNGEYEVDPTRTVTSASTARVAADTARETTTLVGDAGHVSYGSFNLENLSPVPDANGNDTQAKVDARFATHANEVVNALHSPDVLGLQEVQDNDGDLGTTALAANQTIQKLIDAIAAAGGPTYKYVEVAPTSNGTSGGDPNGNIRDVFLYNPARVDYVDGSAHRLDNPVFAGTRYPLVADFTFNGQTFTAIDQHSTSRGGSDPTYSSNQPPAQAGDGSRTAQADAIQQYIIQQQQADPNHSFVVNGDFNGYYYEKALTDLVTGTNMTNLYTKLAPEERYSYSFDGTYEAFDNILVSTSRSADSSFDVVHYNAGYADGLSTTDHDQVVATIGFARGGGAATAVADSYATTAAAVLHGTVVANDTGGTGALTVTAINGSAAIGTQDHLASGAIVTLQADGSFAYDTDGAFAGLAAGATATDQFSYTLAGGSSAIATITVTGVATPAPDANGHINGTSGNDTFGGTPGADYFDLSAGGNDGVDGGAGADAFFMGAALTAADHINGGSGNDQVGLQGDYTGANALVLSPTTLTNVETLALLPGGSAPHSYDITSSDATVAAGQTLTVFGTNLAAGENLTFNGSAETDGSFLFFGGAGTDTLTGGAKDDAFYFGPDKFGPNDIVHGGGGIDQLGLDGHSGALTLDSTHTDVEVLALLKGPAGYAPDSYGTITVDDSWVAAGQSKTITAMTSFDGSTGPVVTPLVVDGSHESDSSLNIYGGSGNDTLIGGAGADHLYGGLGADTLTGGAGADVFLYNDARESTGSGFDTLTDFTFGSDTLNIAGEGADSYSSVNGGKLSAASFDADLQAAVGTQLSTGHAVFFTPTTGDFANQTFLVVDAHGAPGYQAGGDFVFHMPAAPVNPTGTADFITH